MSRAVMCVIGRLCLLLLVTVSSARAQVGLSSALTPHPSSLIANLFSLPGFAIKWEVTAASTGSGQASDAQRGAGTILSGTVEVYPSARAARWQICEKGRRAEEGLQLDGRSLVAHQWASAEPAEGSDAAEAIWELVEGEMVGPEVWRATLSRELAGADLSQGAVGEDGAAAHVSPPDRPGLVPGSLAAEPVSGELVWNAVSGLPIRLTLEYRSEDHGLIRQTEEFRPLELAAVEKAAGFWAAAHAEYGIQEETRRDLEAEALRLAHQIGGLVDRPEALDRKCSALLARRRDVLRVAVVDPTARAVASADRTSDARPEEQQEEIAWAALNWESGGNDRDSAWGRWLGGSYLAIAPITQASDLLGFVYLVGSLGGR